jgi:hypothetical protein
MKMTLVSTVLSAGVVLGLAIGCTAQASPSAQTEQPAGSGQARIAETTLKLEKAFDDQFVHGKIDRDALAGAIDDVVQAMPVAARPKVQSHIEQVLTEAEGAIPQSTEQQRAEVAAPATAEKVGKTAQAWASAWGWPGYAGFGGYGAFGFPGMYYGTGLYGGGLGYGTGLYGAGLGYGALGCGLGACGLGTTGWFW